MKGNMEKIDNSRPSVSVETKEQESLVAERHWLVGEIEDAIARNADYLQAKYKVNGIICKHTVDIDKWRYSSNMKCFESITEVLNTKNFEGFVKDEGSVELIYKESTTSDNMKLQQRQTLNL